MDTEVDFELLGKKWDLYKDYHAENNSNSKSHGWYEELDLMLCSF